MKIDEIPKWVTKMDKEILSTIGGGSKAYGWWSGRKVSQATVVSELITFARIGMNETVLGGSLSKECHRLLKDASELYKLLKEMESDNG